MSITSTPSDETEVLARNETRVETSTSIKTVDVLAR